jgi:hypothetical protein
MLCFVFGLYLVLVRFNNLFNNLKANSIFSYDRPQIAETNKFIAESPHKKILEFNYEIVQLNRLNW